jgi:hypothetical protein
MTTPVPATPDLFSHRAEDEPVEYPVLGVPEEELSTPFSAVEGPDDE